MKFGRNLPRNQVPEWATSYIKYKSLKKLIKSTVEYAKHGEHADTAEFFYSLDRNLENVDNFYNKKYEDAARRLKLLHDRYGETVELIYGIDKDEAKDLMGALLELRGLLRKLQWYGEVNRRGFIKITKKLDKKVPQTSNQQPYLKFKVDTKQFATNDNLAEALRDVNDWLLKLGDVKVYDDSDSIGSAQSIHRVTSEAKMDFPTKLLDAAERAVRDDDAKALADILMAETTSHGILGSASPSWPLIILQRALSCRAKGCIDMLLGMIPSLEESDDVNKRNCIHRLVISHARASLSNDEEAAADVPPHDTSLHANNFAEPAASLSQYSSVFISKGINSMKLVYRDEGTILLLQYLLDQLRPQQRDALSAKDVYGRMPLHYAAQYGMLSVCQIIVAHMKSWGQYDVRNGIDSPFWQDSEGYAPLHLSVIGGHPFTVQTLLEAEHSKEAIDCKTAVCKNIVRSGEALALATKANLVAIVRLLVEADVDINYQDDQGETALHIAARFNHTDCANVLLAGNNKQKADIEIPESAFGWTPLFVSCVDGNLGMVELLIAAGANVKRMDASGWTAKEHATLRGHVNIWRILDKLTRCADAANSGDSNIHPSSAPSKSSSSTNLKSNGANGGSYMARKQDVVKTFGHRYLTEESMILVSLGTMDTRKEINAVNLDRIPLMNGHTAQLDTALSLVVSASGANGEPSTTDLPVQDNVNTEPIMFTASDPMKVRLLFDVVPTYAQNNDQVVGRGVALLSSIKPSIGSKRITLQGDVAIPIIAATTLEVIGTVNFNFLVITPFTHPNMTINENQTYWKGMTSTMLIGHRGLGKNVAARKSLQLGENTIQSFIAAANLGASYVEFDVQLTKDHVPVIYHDFLVSETGIDAPVHTLTLEQFLHVGEGRTPRPSRPASPILANGIVQALKGADARRTRSMSASESAKDQDSDMSERMKHTRDFKEKGFKGNSRGNFIQAPFTTLEEMFIKLPETIGFNIEMKYPMLYESEEQGMDTYAVELNSFVDSVLTKVYDLSKTRNVIFSSFNPDICLLLSFKQPSIPILFLTDAGISPVGDIRATSLQEAIRFASRWNLLGVVTAAEPLVVSPRLVRVIKESGLVCVSYGQLNNDSNKVKLQVKEGIDAVIVDSVLAIRQGLTDTQS